MFAAPSAAASAQRPGTGLGPLAALSHVQASTLASTAPPVRVARPASLQELLTSVAGPDERIDPEIEAVTDTPMCSQQAQLLLVRADSSHDSFAGCYCFRCCWIWRTTSWSKQPASPALLPSIAAPAHSMSKTCSSILVSRELSSHAYRAVPACYE